MAAVFWFAAGQIATAGSIYSWSVLNDSPIAYYRLDETTGQTTAVNAANPGTYNGTYQSKVTAGTAGLRSTDTIGGHPLLGFESTNRAADFPGGNTYGYNGAVTSSIAALGNDYTIECWFRNERVDDPDIQGYFVSRGKAEDKQYDALGICGTAYSTNKNKLLGYNGTASITGSQVVSHDAWHHVAFTRSGNEVRIYLDGRLTPETSGTLARTFTTGDISIGTRFGVWPVDGKIDEVAIYNRTLEAGEIREHYYSAFVASLESYGDSVLQDTPAAYWRMTESAGTTAVDSSGNGNAGAYGSTMVLGDSLPRATDIPGLDGPATAARFPGVSGTGTMRAEVDGLGNDYTAEFWFYNERPNNQATITGYLFSRAGDGSKNGDQLGIAGTYQSSTDLGQLAWYNGTTLIYGQAVVTENAWHHVAMVRDGNDISVYLDGNTTPELTAAGYAATFTAGEESVLFGGRFDGDWPFLGRMRDAVIFTDALTADQIHAHFLAGVTAVPEPANLVLATMGALGLLFSARRRIGPLRS